MNGLVLFKMQNTEFDFTKRLYYSIAQVTIMIVASYFVILLINKPSWFIHIAFLFLYLAFLIQAFLDNKWHIDELLIYEDKVYLKIRRFNKLVFENSVRKSEIKCLLVKTASGSGVRYKMAIEIEDFGKFILKGGKVWNKKMFEEVIKALNNSQVTSVI